MLLLLSILGFQSAVAQIDSTLLRKASADTSRKLMNMDAIYNRPFFAFEKLPVSLGGYVEANWQHLGTDGVSEGHQFQFRRLTLFVASSISRRIRFLSEIEFEDGAKLISIEFAAIDVEFHPLLNFRGGMILNPIGAFNQNHDGPKWEFTDRPLSATSLLPATFSNAGFGFYGKKYLDNWMFGYECYLSGGFNDSIISNPEGRTFLPATKRQSNRFEESINGEPFLSSKFAVKHTKAGELGLSGITGIYNAWRSDGMILDVKRRCTALALDYNNSIPGIGLFVTGEFAWVIADVPETYSQQFGSGQAGGFLDLVQTIWKKPILGWKDAAFNLALRLEYLDYNTDSFRETGDAIGDEIRSIMPGISFRPSSQTVFRINYRFMLQTDLLGNEPAKTGGFSFGISSYF